MAAELTDRLQRLRVGEAAAKQWLYDQFASRLYRRLRRRYGPSGFDVEGLLHDAFVLFYQRDARVLVSFLDRVPEEERTDELLERHLWDLACGVVSNQRRKRRLKPTVPLNEKADPPAAWNPEERNIDRDVLTRLAECLRDGRARVYLYFTLRFIDGLTPEEISVATGWSRKSTYKLKQSLNEALEACLGRLGLSP